MPVCERGGGVLPQIPKSKRIGTTQQHQIFVQTVKTLESRSLSLSACLLPVPPERASNSPLFYYVIHSAVVESLQSFVPQEHTG